MTNGAHAMAIGIHMIATDETIHPAKLAAALEERGFDSLFFADHSHIPVRRETPYPAGGDLPREYSRTLDPVAALSIAAGVTTNLLLGTGVALLTQRDPIQVAKEIATLDFLSGGRALFGVGVGWVLEEMRNHGTDASVRGAVLDERMAAMVEIWTNDEAEFHGKHVDFDPIYSWPKPVRKPHPPVYIGGHSPRAITRARHFGGWMPVGVAKPEAAAAQVAQVRPETSVLPLLGGITEFNREIVDAYRVAGATGAVIHLPNAVETETLHALDDLADLLDLSR